jgi:hypothetical protein
MGNRTADQSAADRAEDRACTVTTSAATVGVGRNRTGAQRQSGDCQD